MKVLTVSPYIYDASLSKFSKNKTGLGIMVKNILDSVSNYNDMSLITNVFNHQIDQGNYKIVKHTWLDFIKGIRFKNIFFSIKILFKLKGNLIDKIKHLYYAMDLGYLEKKIKQINPDLVHFHGVGLKTEMGIKICEKLNINYLVTLHGIVGVFKEVPQFLKDSEKRIINHIDNNSKIISVISSGVKNRLIEHYNIANKNSIKVIPNGTKLFNEFKKSNKIREKFNIPKDGKILLSVGNISKRKNQEQIIDALKYLNDDDLNNLYVFFIGNKNKEIDLDKKIKELNLSDNIKLLGFVEKKEMDEFYNVADFNIVVSKDEGFGLSIIESFFYGIPTLIYDDLDAIPDVYNDKSMMLLKNRNTRTLSKGILDFINKEWDRNYIKNYANNFTLEKMAKKYQKIYEFISNKD